MLWRQCWCQRCFQWGPGKGKQMAAVTVEHGWLLVHNTEQWSAVQNCWASSGCGRLGKVAELAERQRLLAYPQCCVNETQFLCVLLCPHHMAALAWIDASSGICIICRLGPDYTAYSTLAFLLSQYMMKYLSGTLVILTFIDLYFLGGFSTHGAFIRTEKSGVKR